MPVLIRDVVLLDPTAPVVPATASAVLLEDGRIAWSGPDADAPSIAPATAPSAASMTTLDGQGALLLPAFVDAHVHTTATGLVLTGLDLSDVRSAVELLDRVGRAARPGQVLLGHGWDESGWADQRRPTGQQLSRATGGSPAYLSRADLHSALATPDLTAGVDHDDGRVRLDAHHTVRARALAAVTSGQAREAQRAALAEAGRLGIGAIHEMSGPEVASAEDLTSLLGLAATEPGPAVTGYWGALDDLDTAVALGAQPGGDLFVDGSFGSHTAALAEPYDDEPGTSGTLRYDAGDVSRHVLAAAERGLQAGFHCIGDRAVRAVLDGIVAVADRIGLDRVRAGRHRLEHLELLAGDDLARVAHLGLVASVQPAFDHRWAGQMYPDRLGRARAAATNPFGPLAEAGVVLAFGSDAPVTPLDPWGGVRAAVDAQHPVGLRAALAAHVGGGAYAARDTTPGVGTLRVGAPATVALWESDSGRSRRVGSGESAWNVAALLLRDDSRRCTALVVGGRVVHRR